MFGGHVMRLHLLPVALAALATMGFMTEENAQTVTASYYKTGAITANGEPYIPLAHTAAHRKLPFGTLLLVENVANGKSVVVRVNDRGPYIEGRSIDLSYGAARALGMIESGLADVKLTKLD
jgi:rare lipoprotein A